MEVRPVEFQLKGTRDYVHGTDMFNLMTQATGSAQELSRIRFSAHGFVRTTTCLLYIADSKEELNDVADVHARCTFNVNGNARWLAVVPNEGSSSSATRYPYDEDRVTSLCTLKEQRITLNGISPFTFIESIVAMSKLMHQLLFSGEAGKWIFTRIDLDRYCDAHEGLALQLKHNMNFHLTKSDVLVDGEKVGDMYFSLVKS